MQRSRPTATQPWATTVALRRSQRFLLALAVLTAFAGAVQALDIGLALNQAGLTWVTGGDSPWFAQTSISHTDGAAAQSGAIGNSQTSWVQTVVSGPGLLTFWQRVSSEQNWDFLRCYIDADVVSAASGEVDWQRVSTPVGAGSRTLRWEYTKDTVFSAGLDRAWVDEVNFGSGFAWSVTGTNVSDHVGTVRLSVWRLGSSAGTVSVDYRTTNGTAQAGTDYVATNGTLTFGAGVTSLTASVQILANAVAQNDVQFSLLLANASSGWGLGGDAVIHVIDTAPTITWTSEDQTNYVGDSAMLSVNANGAALAFQWFRGDAGDNSHPVPASGIGSTWSEYATPPLTVSTSYWARVSNPSGVATSRTIHVTVLPQCAPLIVQEPNDQTGYQGDTVWLRIRAGGGGLTYEWFGGVVGTTSTPVQTEVGGSDSWFWTPPLTQTTSYWVRISNSLGAITSRTAVVTVQTKTAPVIQQQPQDQSVFTGQSANLFMQVAGGGVTVQWFGGSAGNTGNLLRTDTGASFFNYSTPLLYATTSYWALVSNTVGVATSRTAVVTVTAPSPPVITAQPADQNIDPGEVAYLDVSASGGGGSMTFEWFGGSAGNTGNLVRSTTGFGSDFYATPVLFAATSYWVRVGNAYGSTTSRTAVVTVTAQTMPVFTYQPNDQTIYESEAAYFYVMASGGGLTFRWFGGIAGNTSNLLKTDIGGTSSSYTTPSLFSSTNCWILVSNSVGVITSRTVVVTVTQLTTPTIAYEPNDQAIYQGESAFFYVQANGGVLTFQWYRGSAGDTNNPVRTETGGYSSDYGTPPLYATTSYWVRVSNSAGAVTSRTAVVTVTALTKPVITSGPNDQNINQGESAYLNVNATGGGMTFQWFGGVSGDTSQPLTASFTAPTWSSYDSPPLSASTSYWVRVSNSAGVTNSHTAVVTVTIPGPPTITSQPTNQTIDYGSWTFLDISATASGGGSITFEWFGGSAGNTGNLVQSYTSWSGGDYYYTPTLYATTSYWVRVGNAYGSATSRTAVVTVRPPEPPIIVSEPADQTVEDGGIATLSATVTGPGLTFNWYEGESGDTSVWVGNSYGGTNSEYSTASLSATTKFWVQISNIYGTTNSRAAIVTVNPGHAPVITREPADQTVVEGDAATLRVAATGGRLSFNWYEGESGDTSTWVGYTSGADGATSEFQVTPTASTRFWVQISNDYGETNSLAAVVTVNPGHLPVITREPTDRTVEEGGVATLSVAASGGGLTFNWYQGESGDTSTWVGYTIGGTNSECSTPSITVATRFWVQIGNSYGETNSRAVTVTVGAPLEAPQITWSVIGANVLRLQWPSQTGVTYQMHCATVLNGWADHGSPYNGDGTTQSCDIVMTGLPACALYRVQAGRP